MDNYTKILVLGSGSFGNAWLVRNRKGEECVIKEISIPAMKLKDKEAAINEVKILATLKHKNIIRYKEAFVLKKNLCICMEYANDGDLSTKIKQQYGKLFLELEIIDWFVQILIAVKYIHSLHILHRDLKSQNIFLMKTGLVKIGDFGISRFLDGGLQQARTAIGTPYYLSPEICQHKPYNNKSDMWSLGVLLYELSTLYHPFLADEFSNLVVKIIKGKYQPLSNCYGPLLQDLVLVLLQVNPTDRPSAAQLLKVPALQPHIRSYLMRVKHKEEPVIFDSDVFSSGDDEKIRDNGDSHGSSFNGKCNYSASKKKRLSLNLDNPSSRVVTSDMGSARNTIKCYQKNERVTVATKVNEEPKKRLSTGSNTSCKTPPEKLDKLKLSTPTANQKKLSKINFVQRNKNLAGTSPCSRVIKHSVRISRIKSIPEALTKVKESTRNGHSLRSRIKSTDAKLPLLAAQVKELSTRGNCIKSTTIAPKNQPNSILNDLKPSSHFMDPEICFPSVRKRAAKLMSVATDSEKVACKLTKRSISCEDKARMMSDSRNQAVTVSKCYENGNARTIGNVEVLKNKDCILKPPIHRSCTEVDKDSLLGNSLYQHKQMRRASVGLPQGSCVSKAIKSKIASRVIAASNNSAQKIQDEIDCSDKSDIEAVLQPLHSTLKDGEHPAGIHDVIPNENKQPTCTLSQPPRSLNKKFAGTYTLIHPTVKNITSPLHNHLIKVMGVRKVNKLLDLTRKISLKEEDYEMIKAISDTLGIQHTEYMPCLFELVYNENVKQV